MQPFSILASMVGGLMPHKNERESSARSSNASKGVSEGEIYSNASTFMTAGIETTATALSGLTWLLCKNPESLQKLTDEICGLGGRESLTGTKLQRLVYLNAYLEEGLRRNRSLCV
ncbi:hypothetical protein N7537_009026 [Penicillium hordei]|uniref:Uncharacterized protein n=1 Tax=Penicillium hordei TaxID=40994 RepID=A0AAD6DTE5_9EURO|nr:uncharacterized protein N7537_009026 [Penicillium hordei]KAJ5592122.1 hypothetical protein N7537_009026 [Penicillium hordei]